MICSPRFHFFEDRRAKHDEFASTLRDTQAPTRGTRKAASETTAKKSRGRKRKTVPEPDCDDEDNTGAARCSQPRSRKRARTTAPAEPHEESYVEALVDSNLVAGRVKRVVKRSAKH